MIVIDRLSQLLKPVSEHNLSVKRGKQRPDPRHTR